MVRRRAPHAPGPLRRRRVRRAFDAYVRQEHRRLVGNPQLDLRRTLLERFLRRNLAHVRGPFLEVGPGTGRLTPTLLGTGERTLLLDLSRPMLRAARRHLRRVSPRRPPWGLLQGAAEGFRPFRDQSFGAVVIVGLLGFFGHDGAQLLLDARRTLRPGGVLIVEGVGPSNATSLELSLPRVGALRIYREPDRFHLWDVVRRGFQPYDPPGYARWDFRFWRPPELTRAIEAAGFTVRERMALAPTMGSQREALRYFHRDPRAWRNLQLSEEEMGHWEECLGLGPSYLVAARRSFGP